MVAAATRVLLSERAIAQKMSFSRCSGFVGVTVDNIVVVVVVVVVVVLVVVVSRVMVDGEEVELSER